MKLGFEEAQRPYTSGSQSARAWTERWVREWVFCPNCGSPKINRFEVNRPVADFYCGARHMSPCESDDLTEVIEECGDTFVVLRSPATAEHSPEYKSIGRFSTFKRA